MGTAHSPFTRTASRLGLSVVNGTGKKLSSSRPAASLAGRRMALCETASSWLRRRKIDSRTDAVCCMPCTALGAEQCANLFTAARCFAGVLASPHLRFASHRFAVRCGSMGWFVPAPTAVPGPCSWTGLVLHRPDGESGAGLCVLCRVVLAVCVAGLAQHCGLTVVLGSGVCQ